jgi:Protein of unknown function (DUF2723)
MKPNRSVDAVVLIAATALTRFIFRSHYLYDIDSVNFALALKRFDPSVHQPHPPGYFLYVCLGRVADSMFHDANAAFVAISIVFSCGAVAMIYVLAGDWFGRQAARFAGLIFVFSPLAWFHGTVALTYVVESFFSGLTGYLCWLVFCGKGRFILPAAAVVGVAAGFRPSSLLLLAPAFLFSLRAAGRKQAAGGIGILVLTLLAWFMPMIRISGAAAYTSALVSLWLTVPSRGTIFNSSPSISLARAGVVFGGYLLCFGIAAALPVLNLCGDSPIRRHVADRGKILFIWFWMAPGLLFFVFVFLTFVNSGYLLVLAPPVCAWTGLWAANWYAALRMARSMKLLLVAGCAAANTMIFVFAPVYCSYGRVRRFESELRSIIDVLPQVISSRDAMIVGFDSHFLGYRHAGYYLPGYLTVQFPETRIASGTGVFMMQSRDTRMEGHLCAASVREFVMFPLPAGDKEYSDYMALVRKRFPPGELRTVIQSGRVFTIGPVADLPLLFPHACPRKATDSDVVVDSR